MQGMPALPVLLTFVRVVALQLLVPANFDVNWQSFPSWHPLPDGPADVSSMLSQSVDSNEKETFT